MLISTNAFVLRQTADSKFSHYAGGWESLVALVEANFAKAAPGYRDGVVLVPVPAEGFFSGVVEVTKETVLKTSFEARRADEAPFIQTVALGASKLPARHVEVVLYRHDVLGDDATSEAAWEIVSINARPTESPEPLTPMAMARNMLGLPGGTPARYSAEEFAKAILYWSTRVMCG